MRGLGLRSRRRRNRAARQRLVFLWPPFGLLLRVEQCKRYATGDKFRDWSNGLNVVFVVGREKELPVVCGKIWAGLFSNYSRTSSSSIPDMTSTDVYTSVRPVQTPFKPSAQSLSQVNLAIGSLAAARDGQYQSMLSSLDGEVERQMLDRILDDGVSFRSPLCSESY